MERTDRGKQAAVGTCHHQRHSNKGRKTDGNEHPQSKMLVSVFLDGGGGAMFSVCVFVYLLLVLFSMQFASIEVSIEVCRSATTNH